MNNELAELAGKARESKGPIRIKDPIQAEKMKQMMNQQIHGWGQGMDLSNLPADMRREVLRQRVRQKQYLIGMQRTNMNARQVAMEEMEERMKNMMTNMPGMAGMAGMAGMPAQGAGEEGSSSSSEEELTEEQREARRRKNQKKRLRRKKNKSNCSVPEEGWVAVELPNGEVPAQSPDQST